VRAYLDNFQFEPAIWRTNKADCRSSSIWNAGTGLPVDELVAESERWKSELSMIEFEDKERTRLDSDRKARLEGRSYHGRGIERIAAKGRQGTRQESDTRVGRAHDAGGPFSN